MSRTCHAVRDGPPRRAASPAAPTPVPSIVREVLRSPGRPLDPATGASMGTRFGHDFGRVRIHTGPQAAESARAVDSLAYTVGHDVVFGAGQYAPQTREGIRLLAHELTHTIQQGDEGRQTRPTRRMTDAGSAVESEAQAAAARIVAGERAGAVRRSPLELAREPSEPSSPAPAEPQAYGEACSGGPTDPCQEARCTQQATITGDLERATRYVDAAVSALSASPRTSATERALDWYFGGHNDTTVDLARTRLDCIRMCLTDTSANDRFGCDPDHDALAYVCVGSTGICGHVRRDICFTQAHFREGGRVRAQTVIHECAHRVGMSLGAPESVPDVYRFQARFLYMDPAECLQNSDAFAMFAGAIAEGMDVTVLFPVVGGAGGFAVSGTGPVTWQARLYMGAEFQHPVLGLFNPTLGIGMSVIGEPATPGGAPASPTSDMLVSLLPGVRIGAPRPGAAGGGYASFFGGPSLAVSGGTPGLGAEAGMALGYRWRWLDVSAAVGYAYDPTRRAGMEHLFTGSIGVTFTPSALTR